MGLFTKLFGGNRSESESKSWNQAYPQISGQFGSWLPQAGDSYGAAGDFLKGGFGEYADKTGYDFVMDRALDDVGTSHWAAGLGKSGAIGKAMQDRAAGVADSYRRNYLTDLMNHAGMGINAGSLIAGAGSRSEGSSEGSSDNGGFGKFVGALLASDRRLKRNIVRIGTLADGLGVYSYDYRTDIAPDLPTGRQRGVMADEVAQIRPWALGPTRPDGFATVDYSQIAEAA